MPPRVVKEISRFADLKGYHTKLDSGHSRFLKMFAKRYLDGMPLAEQIMLDDDYEEHAELIVPPLHEGVLWGLCSIGVNWSGLGALYEQAGFPETHGGVRFWGQTVSAQRLDFALIQV